MKGGREKEKSCGEREGVWRKRSRVEKEKACGEREGVWRKRSRVEKEKACGDREEAQRLGYGSVAARFYNTKAACANDEFVNC